MTGLFDGGFAWADDPPARPVAATATDAATAQMTGKQPECAAPNQDVASVASVAEWQDGVARFARMRRPDFLSNREWVQIQNDVRGLASLWADDLFALGWSLQEVFGWSPFPELNAIEPAGLIRYLQGRPIDAVDANSASIVQLRGAPLIYRRHDPASNAPFDRSGAVPIWIALDPKRIAP